MALLLPNYDARNNSVWIQMSPLYIDTANKKRNDQPLLFKASILSAQGHVYEWNHYWDDREVVGIWAMTSRQWAPVCDGLG